MPKMMRVTGLTVCVLILAAARPALADPPATGKLADGPLLQPKDLKQLQAMARQLNRRQWGPSVVETFDKAPAADLWQCTGGKIQHKDRMLVITPDAVDNVNIVRTIQVYRPLPEACRGDAIRIDAWLYAEPGVRKIGNRELPMFTLGLVLGGGNVNALAWEYWYYFATGSNGSMQSFRATTGSVSSVSSTAQALPPGKLIHASLEIAGRQVRCQRDANAPLTTTLLERSMLRAGDQTNVGLYGQFKQLRLVKVAFRPMEPAVAPAVLDAEWKKTSFANQTALTAHLVENVLPRLEAAQYRQREEANSLLESLWPLSRPAIEAAAKNPARFGDEGRLRIQELAGYLPVIQVVTTRPDEAAKPPAGFADLPPPPPPASQPDQDKKKPGEDNPALLPGKPVPVEPVQIVPVPPAPPRGIVPAPPPETE